MPPKACFKAFYRTDPDKTHDTTDEPAPTQSIADRGVLVARGQGLVAGVGHALGR